MRQPHYETMCTISGPSGQLRGLKTAALNDHGPGVIALLFHPNPTGGGNYNHKILSSIARTLRQNNIVSYRFNTRGVGPLGTQKLPAEHPNFTMAQTQTSDGSFDDGRGELEDAQAMYAYVCAQHPKHSVVLCGFSFGGYLASQLAANHASSGKIIHLLTIAPAISMFSFPKANTLSCPWSMLQAMDDEIIEAQTNLNWSQQNPSIHLTCWETGGHFFHGLMPQLQDWAWQALKNSIGDQHAP